jgi:siroheme synthase-like protein
MMPDFYPVFLDLRQRLCAVVGGGAVAEEKTDGLLAAGARVRLIAGELNKALHARASRGEVEHIARSYRPGDLEGTFLVLAERISPQTDDAVWAEAEQRGIPVNVQDDNPHCSFIAPSIVRRGHLQIAISTSGKAPVLAVRLRQMLERRIGPHHARFLDLAGRLRGPVAKRHPDFATRKKLWYRLIDSDILRLLKSNDPAAAESRAAEILGVRPEPADRPALTEISA